MPMRMKDGQKDKALHVLRRGWVNAPLGAALSGTFTRMLPHWWFSRSTEKLLYAFSTPTRQQRMYLPAAGRRACGSRCTATTTSMALSRRTTICATLRRCRRARRCTSSVATAACGGRATGRTRQAGLTGRGRLRPFLVLNSKFIILNNSATFMQLCFRDNGYHGQQKPNKTRCFRAQTSSFLRLLTEGL